MNVGNYEATRNPRIGERSVVSPSVLIDISPPRRPRKAGSSISVARLRSSTRQRRPKFAERNDDFRYFIDRQGRQHFNFRQRVWLDASVQMACTRGYSLALETLALNLLTMATRARDYRAAVGITSRRAVLLAPSFSRECLLGAPDEAWALPKASIRAWVQSQLRIGTSTRAR
jgi:hypothetical protein